MDEILAASALTQAALVATRKVGARELVDAYLARIDAADRRLNAFVELQARRARNRADAIDRRVRSRGFSADERPPMLGVPSAIKDADPMRGAWFRAGSRALKYVWSPVDGPVASRVRKLGVNLVGKTSTSELGLMPIVETDLQPPTVNPWNTAYTAGGSSGGSAAAVAGGLLPLASASDGAGSIRIPASLNHLFGFKPSIALTPRFYGAFDPVGLAVAGCVAHYVEDSAAVMDALAGGRPGEPSLVEASRRAPPRGLRVGICTASPLVEVAPAVRAGVEELARLLTEMGHHVEPRDVTDDGTLDEFIPIYGRLLANPPTFGEARLQPVTRWIRQQGRQIDNAEAIRLAAGLARRVDDWFGDLDLALLPTVAADPPRAGAFAALDPESQFRAAASLGVLTAPFNLSGQPAASVPIGLSPAGLPMGAQVVARRGEDALLFSVCGELERALRWQERRAPGSY